MIRQHEDLLAILDDEMRRAGDNRFIWCEPSDGFDTRVSRRRGILLGGAWSPHFLRDEASFSNIPSTMRLHRAVIVRVERAVTPLQEWIPLMEAILKAGESMLLVTKEISTELLHTLLVNSIKGTLACCVARMPESLPALAQSSLNTMWEFADTPPRSPQNLPRASEAWCRRNATVVFPAPDGERSAVLNDISVISVGGKNQADLYERVRFLVEAIQEQSVF